MRSNSTLCQNFLSTPTPLPRPGDTVWQLSYSELPSKKFSSQTTRGAAVRDRVEGPVGVATKDSSNPIKKCASR